MKRVLLISGIGGAALRYRAQFPQEALADLGIAMDIHMYRDPAIIAKARAADAVVCYRTVATEMLMDVVSMVRQRGDIPVLYDIDDLVFDESVRAHLDPVLAATGVDLEPYWAGVRRHRTMLEVADAYIGSTRELMREVDRLIGIPTYRYWNGVGHHLADVSERARLTPRRPGPLRLGYFSGTNTHNEDFGYCVSAIAEFLRRHRTAQLHLGGLLDVSDALGEFADRIVRIPMRQWHQLPSELRQVDINLATLVPGTQFNDAKSAIKFTEAALVGTPTIATPSEPFREAIQPGVTGMLATSADQWLAALEYLAADDARRDGMGLAARQWVLTHLTAAQQGPVYRDILLAAREHLLRHGHRDVVFSCSPEVAYEPVSADALDYYGPAHGCGDSAAPTARFNLPQRLRQLRQLRLRSGRRPQ